MTTRLLALILAVLAASVVPAAGPIHEAVRAGDVARVAALLAAEPGTLNARDDRGQTPLHVACTGKDAAIIRLLLEKGADVSVADADGNQALHLALGANRPEAVALLLAAKADVNAVSPQLGTPIGQAIDDRRAELLDIMLASGAPIETHGETGRQHLHEAAARGLGRVVEWMLAHGADAASRDDYGGTLLHSASAGGLEGLVERLLASGASIDPPDVAGYTPLIRAARGWASADREPTRAGRQAVVNLLLARGANPDVVGADGVTLLHAAASGNHVGVMETMLGRGRRVTDPDRYGRTPLLFAVEGDAPLETVKWLLARGADPNARDFWGTTPVHEATFHDRIDVLEVLSAAGARLDEPYWGGDTPLLAGSSASPDTLFWLIQHGARLDAVNNEGDTLISRAAAEGLKDLLERLWPEADRRGLTRAMSQYPLHRAAYHAQPAIAEFLLGKGLGPDQRDERGKTPLHRAAQGGALEVARLLLGKGAKVDARDTRGLTPLHDAVARGREEMVRLLLERKADPNVLTPDKRSALDLAAVYGYPAIARTLSGSGGTATASKPPTIATLLATPPPQGQARVWYLHHCAFAVRTANHLLVFDYARGGPVPPNASLANGFINPEEIKDLDVVVFVSHGHQDHFDPAIFDWQKTVRSIRYVFGWPEREGPRITTVGSHHASARLGDIDVHVVNANHNLIPEVAYLVKVDGLAIVHSGDYSATAAEAASEMGYLKKLAGGRIDLAFLSMYGPFVPHLQPAVAVPTHMNGVEYWHEGAARAIERLSPGTRGVAFDNKGERLSYARGRATKEP